MSNEAKSIFTRGEEERKLVGFYRDLLDADVKPSKDYQKKFLLQLLNTKIAVLEGNTNSKKRLHFVLRISVMILSGLSTVILGFKFGEGAGLSEQWSNITLIITAVITLLSGLAVFWDTENYWIRNKIMLNKLKEIRYEYVFFLTGNPAFDSKDLKIYLDKFLASLGDEYWEKFLKDVRRNKEDHAVSG